MRKISLAAAPLALALAAAPAAAEVNIVDNNQTLTADCAKEKSVNIAGNKATVTLKGTCDVVNIAGNKATVKGSAAVANVSGNKNTLALDAVDSIVVSGNENAVTYKKGGTVKAPQILDSGTNNKVSKVK